MTTMNIRAAFMSRADARVAVQRLVVAFALAFVATPATALDPHMRLTEYSLTNWGEDAGPFPFGIYAITQDHEGYLWLGARTGLFRFDGTIFKKWSGSTALPNDRVSALYVGTDGSLWVGFDTTGGISRIHKGQVTNFNSTGSDPLVDVNDLAEDQDGVMWASTYSGLLRFTDGRWNRAGIEDGLPRVPVFAVLDDSRRNLWVATSMGVYRRNHDATKFELITPAVVAGFAENAAGAIVMSDRENGFALLQRGAGTAEPVPSKGKPGRWMRYDRFGSLWVSTRSGGVLRVRESAASGPIVERLTRREGLPSNEIHCVFEDGHGTLWFGTRMGLTRLQERNVRATLLGDDAFVSSVVRGGDGSVWIGTSEGVRRRVGEHEQTFALANGLPSRFVTAMHTDRSGTLWVATARGIVRFVDDRFVPIEPVPSIPLAGVWSMTSRRDGALWLCDRSRGLLQWKDGKLTQVDESLTRRGAAHVAYTDSHDRVWVGLWTTGLGVYGDKQLAFYTVDDGLPPGSVNVVYEDPSHSIWVGTSDGVARFENGRFVTFASSGFPHSPVMSIIADDAGFLWFGSTEGLIRVGLNEFERVRKDPSARLHYKLYGTEDGVPGTIGRPGMPNSARAADGNLWFVTSVGLAVVDPANLPASAQPAPVRIEGLAADGVTASLESKIALPPRTSRVQIDYSMLSLTAVGKPRFQYKLENFDADWQDAGERRQASYTNLPPGQYRFRVVSSSGERDRNEPGDVVDFSIRPAFYQMTTFRLAALAAAVLAAWAAWQLRLRSVQRRFDLVLAERMRVGREIHDTLLQSLVGVALEFDDIWEQLRPSDTSLREQVQRIREQVEHYIREARNSIWNLRSPMLEANDLPTAVRKVGEAAVAGRAARFEFVLSGTPRATSARVEQELIRVEQEALNNAIRHSNARIIRAELSYESDCVRLRVTDNGDGFDPSRLSDVEGHWGVASMRERAQQVGATFRLDTQPGAGTTIEFSAAAAGGKS